MKLYLHPLSSNARRARITAELTGLAYEPVFIDMQKGEHLAPDYLAINPNHKVPSLVDGELKLWESNAIGIYLAGKAGRTDLWPVDPAAQADVARWLMWSHSTWNIALGTLTFELLVKVHWRKLQPDEAKVADARAAHAANVKLLDEHLAEREWLAQDRLTLADIALAATLTPAAMIGITLDDTPNVAAWFARMTALPAWQATQPPQV